MGYHCAPCKMPRMRVRLRDFRNRMGLTIEQIAERSTYSVSQLSRWERHEGNIPSKNLPALAATYSCRVSDIFADDEADDLNGAAHAPPQQWFPKPETIAELLAFVMRVDEDDSARRAELLVYGNALHTALKWLADDPDRDENDGVVRQIGKRLADEIESGRIAPSQAS